jgi:hypothetical protein
MTVALAIAVAFCFAAAAWALVEFLGIWLDRPRPVRDDDGNWRAP